MDQATPRRFEQNALGPFYTTGECLACGAPEDEAPELLAPLEGDNHLTYFIRQPETPEEVEHACRAAEVCCLSTLRYGGTDPSIIRRLGNRPEFCDHPLPEPLRRFAWESDEQWNAAQKAPGRERRRWWQF